MHLVVLMHVVVDDGNHLDAIYFLGLYFFLATTTAVPLGLGPICIYCINSATIPYRCTCMSDKPDS
jgi:hypothetical protein